MRLNFPVRLATCSAILGLVATQPALAQRRGADTRETPSRSTTATGDASIRAQLASPAAREALRTKVHGLDIDVDALAAHQISPAVLKTVDSFPGDEPGSRGLGRTNGAIARAVDQVDLTLKPGVGVDTSPTLDLAGFGQDLFEDINDDVAGYVLLVRKNGETVHVGQWKSSRYPTDGNKGWSPDTKMHVASVSKLITAIATTKLLLDEGIGWNDGIAPYLPDYWTLGPNMDDVTFAHLLRNTSGFSANGQTDYWTMRQKVAQGLPAGAVGNGGYENMNFGLLRILIATISGRVDTDTFAGTPMGSAPTWHDTWWDGVTIDGYKDYVRNNVFEPSGVYTASLIQLPQYGALGYSLPVAGSGWPQGDLSSVSGAAGWIMSANQLADVMDEFRRGGGIVTPAQAEQALTMRFGIDRIVSTPAGPFYEKNGRWTWGSTNSPSSKTVQAVVDFMPNDVEVVVLVNSWIGPANARRSLRDTVRDHYLANLD